MSQTSLQEKHLTGSSSCRPAGDPDAIASHMIQRAHTRDGLPEIAVGLTFLFAGVLSYTQAGWLRGFVGFKIVVLALSFLIPALCLGAPQALRWVRRRYLVQHMGYVEYKPTGRIMGGILIALSVGVGFMYFKFMGQPSQSDRWLLAGAGILGGALIALIGRLPRFVVGGALMEATGLALALTGVPLPIGFAMLFGSLGLLALISGSVSFLRLMRQPADPA